MKSILKRVLPKQVVINLAIEWLEEAAERSSNSIDNRVVEFIKRAYYVDPKEDLTVQLELSELLSKAARSIRDRVRNIRKKGDE